jgi:polar amino acid transport system substrate-binding protein
MRRACSRLAALAALLGLVVAGCGGAAPENLAKVPEVHNPLVQATGGAVQPDLPPETSSSCGDITRSLPPLGGRPQPGHMPAGSTMAKIAARGRLVVGVDRSTYLFGYRNPKTGALRGFDIDMAHYVADAIFGDPDKVRFEVLDPARRVAALQSGTVDMVADTMAMTCVRRAKVAFSTTYFAAKQSLLVGADSPAKGLPDLAGKKICAAGGTVALAFLAHAGGLVPVSVPDWSGCLALLQQSEVAAVSASRAILAGMAAQDPKTTLIGRPFAAHAYGIGIGKNHLDLVRFVNGVLENVRSDGRWKHSYDRWFGDRLGATRPPPPHYA